MHYTQSNRSIIWLAVGSLVFIGAGILMIQAQPDQSQENQIQKTATANVTSSHNMATVDPQVIETIKNLPKVAGTLEMDKKTFDFGNIPIYGGKVTTSFTLSNPGKDPIVLTRITTSCMCTEAVIEGHSFGLHMSPWANITLQPGESKSMSVTFDPLAHGDNSTGPITRVIAIETNSSTTPTYELKISGTVVKP